MQIPFLAKLESESIPNDDISGPREILAQPPMMDATESLEWLLLYHQDHRVRLSAARALGRAGLGCPSPALVSALHDPVPSVRHAAITSLGETGGDAACDSLKELLVSKSCSVRGMAARALLRALGMPLPVRHNLGLLTNLLSSGDDRVREALLAMGEPAVALLESKLEDDSFCVRQQAASTLALKIRKDLDITAPGKTASAENESVDRSRNVVDTAIAREIASLYSFSIVRQAGSGMKVENSGFDAVSRVLCGKRSIFLSSACPDDLGLNSDVDHGSDAGMNESIETIGLECLLSEHDAGGWRRIGRTLVFPIRRGCLAIKLCVGENDKGRLLAEAKMQAALQSFGLSSGIPVPLGGLFRIEGIQASVLEDLEISEAFGICYTAESEYFVYLNDPKLSVWELERGIRRCSRDLALLARKGFIHTSLIPLFHHHERPSRGGTYCWNRKQAGRLDRWLESCLYPNLRLSGIADLEHIKLDTRLSSQQLQTHIGEHLLSMSLMLGSYFRRKGGFDGKVVASILRDCFQRYYSTLTQGMATSLDCCIEWQNLAERIAEEMDGGKRGDGAPSNLGRINGPFPLPELIRAIHIASLFSVLEVQAEIGQQGQLA